MVRTTLLACVLAVAPSMALAQAPFKITGALVNAAKPVIVSVTFSDGLAQAGPLPAEATVRFEGAPGITVKIVQVSSLPLDALTLQPVATVVASAPLPPGDVRICFDRLGYVRATKVLTTAAPVCGTISSDIASVRAAALKALTETPVAADNEKALNASGFVTTASGASAGGGDLAFNPKLRDPNASVFMRLKKSTVDGGDARHLEFGVSYRAGMPWNRRALEAMRATGDLSAINDLLLERQQAVIAGSLMNVAMKLEADPSTFAATNGVGEAHYQLVTMTRRIGQGAGFWRGYLMPVGAEVGRRLAVDSTGASTTPRDWIARFKAGGGMAVFYQPEERRLPFSRVDLDLNAVWRVLAFDELNFNTATKVLDRTTDGGHGYLQAALKVFFVELGSSRYGVKATYARGSLPPVFAPVKTFQFGFVVESTD